MYKLSDMRRARQSELRKSTDEVRRIRQELDEAYMSFNRTSDPDLLDACIYEINALLARYDHALRHAKTKMR